MQENEPDILAELEAPEARETWRSHGQETLAPLLVVIPYIRPYIKQIFAVFMLMLVGTAITLAGAQVVRYIVDTGYELDRTRLSTGLAIFMAFTIFRGLSAAARNYLNAWLGQNVVTDVRRAVFNSAVVLEPSFFENRNTGEVISRLSGDVATVRSVLGWVSSSGPKSILVLLGGITMLFVTSPRLTAMVLLGLPFIAIPLRLLGKQVRLLSREARDKAAAVSACVDECFHAIAAVQANCYEVNAKERYRNLTEEAKEIALKAVVLGSVLRLSASFIMTAGICGLLWAANIEVQQGRMTVGELTAFVIYAMLVAGNTKSLISGISQLYQWSGSIERVVELLTTEPKIKTPESPTPVPSPSRGQVKLEDVRFCYPTRPEEAALDGFSLDIHPGERVALVGPSGAGKSTVLQLLLRFHDPLEGSVKFDGVDLRDFDPREYRAHLGVVPQETAILGADAWRNIRFGIEEASDDDVRKAADAAHATEFLERLPEGFDTQLGERGVRLSGGQRQRIAIARALLRNPQLLLLDEATSALDSESEVLVQEALDELMQHRTSLVIAHRLATVVGADRILVLDKGKLVASGTHSELLALGGLYARLVELQFRDLTDIEEDAGKRRTRKRSRRAARG